MRSITGPGLWMASLLALAGCATTVVPSARVASAQAAIRASEEVGARAVPTAALHLDLAREQFAQGRRMIREDDNEAAAMVLLRAESDAELALALAREDASRRAADQASETVQGVQRGTN